MPGMNNSVINLGLPSAAPDNFKTAEVRASVELMINTANNLLNALENATGFSGRESSEWASLPAQQTILRQNSGRIYLKASESLTFGSFINIWNNAGVASARKASSDGKPAHGYCNVAVVTAGSEVEIILSQGVLAVNSLLPGQNLYLSSTPGLPGLIPDTTAGKIEQFLGVGVNLGIAYIDISLGQYIQH